MFRMTSVLVIVANLYGSARVSAQDITSDEPFKGRLVGNPGFARDLIRAAPGWRGFGSLHSVTLKEGQSFKLTLTVTGDNRKAGVALFDSSGKEIKSSLLRSKQATLEVDEIPANGKYKILVFSDGLGGFTLKPTGLGRVKLSAQQLREKIERLKQELKEAQEQLEALEKGDS